MASSEADFRTRLQDWLPKLVLAPSFAVTLLFVYGFIAFTVAAVPTGIKAGVRMSPRCMWITPARALPSVAEMLKVKRLVIRIPVVICVRHTNSRSLRAKRSNPLLRRGWIASLRSQ